MAVCHLFPRLKGRSTNGCVDRRRRDLYVNVSALGWGKLGLYRIGINYYLAQ